MTQMAKKKKSTRKAKPAAETTRAASAGDGPVTLEEAEALVQTQTPKSAAPRRSVAAAAASPEAVGAERKKLEEQSRDEIEQRVREYTATLSIMKQRGVKGLAFPAAGAPKRRGPAAPAARNQPLQILAEGDSWFDYPVPLFGGGLIPRLAKRLGVPILNLAKAGDEVRSIMGVEQRELLGEHLRNGCPAGGEWDLLLFSGGGNDIVGNPMALWIDDYRPAVQPTKLINQTRFDAALSLIRAAYEDLIGLRDSLSPSTHLVFHAYDFAIPDGRGVCFMGPWMKPTFDLRKFPTRAPAFDVVKAMLKQFAALLLSLERSHSGVTFINGQGTLVPRPSSWHNELHPSKAGFKKFTEIFYQKIKTLAPNRVV
jgi:hypothetical protein